MDNFCIQAAQSLSMALQNELSDWQNNAFEKGGTIEKFCVGLMTRVGHIATCLIGIIEAVVRFTLSIFVGVFGFLMDKPNYDTAISLTIHGSVISLKAVVKGLISLFTNSYEHKNSQISTYIPAVSSWMNSFFSTPLELLRNQSIQKSTVQPCFSYDFLASIHSLLPGIAKVPNKSFLKNLLELVGTISTVFLSMIEFLFASCSDSVKSLFNQSIDYNHTRATVLTWYLSLAVIYEKCVRFDRPFSNIQKEYLAS